MQRIFSSGFKSAKRHRGAFTLVEVLVVMTVIAILIGLVLVAANGLQAQAARNRARAEIQAISTALEGFKTDNGAYPLAPVLTGPPNSTYPIDPTAVEYQTAAQTLYSSLTGYQHYSDTPVAGTRSYMTLKKSQVGNANVNSAGLSYIKDPWGNPYGYSTGDTSNPQVFYPYAGSGLFDLWTTAGTTKPTAANPTPNNSWINSWQQQ